MADVNELRNKIAPLIADATLKGQFLELLNDYEKCKKELVETKLKNSNHVTGSGNADKAIDIQLPKAEFFDSQTPATDSKKLRDTSRYIYNGRKYNKRDLVYACVKHYVDANPQVTIEKLKEVFPPQLQGSFGVFKTKNDMKIEQRNEEFVRRRFFAQPIEVDGEKCYICSEWNKDNIDRFYKKMLENGFEIEKVYN